MNTKDEALKLALEALVYAFYEDSEYDEACAEIVLKAKTAIKEALAQPEQETKEQRLLRRKWFGHRDTEHLSFAEAVDATMEKLYSQPEAWERLDLRGSTKVYTTPPQRTWVGLDEEEFIYFCAWCDSGTLIEIEKLLESKNI